jgi:hypothetical protein
MRSRDASALAIVNPSAMKLSMLSEKSRFKSVAPRFKIVAESKSRFVSPSSLSLHVADKIFGKAGSPEKPDSSFDKLRESPVKKSIGAEKLREKSLMRKMSLAPKVEEERGYRETEGLGMSVYERQGKVLQKIYSEKRNMEGLKKFAHSGFGRDYNYPYFQRQLI